MILIVFDFPVSQPMVGWWLVFVIYCRNLPIQLENLKLNNRNPFVVLSLTLPCHQLLQASAELKEPPFRGPFNTGPFPFTAVDGTGFIP